MTPTHQAAFHVRARGSTDAADQAKALARSHGFRVRTVCAVRASEPDESRGRDLMDWTVTLALVDPAAETRLSEDQLIAAHGGLPGEAPIG